MSKRGAASAEDEAVGEKPSGKTSDKGVEFALFAPYNEDVKLIGSFSDWEPLEMTRGEDGYFRTRVELEDGTYTYKFRVKSQSPFAQDEQVDVVDPYATSIEDSAEQNGIVRIEGGKRILDTYTWRHDDVPLPANADLVIYELHVSDFASGEDEARGGYLGVVDKLDYLVDLGVNAIELMPVTEFPRRPLLGLQPALLFRRRVELWRDREPQDAHRRVSRQGRPRHR